LVDVQTLYIGALYTVDLHSAALFPPDFPLFAFLGRRRYEKLDKVARRTFKLDDIPPSGYFTLHNLRIDSLNVETRDKS